MPDGLSQRERMFVAEYLRTGEGKRSAEFAGYSKRSASKIAYELLRRPHVAAAIEQGRRQIEARTEITVDRVVRELWAVLTSDLAEAMDETGNLLPLPSWPEHLRRAVSGYKVTKDGVEVKLWNKTTASDQLLRHLGGYARDNEQKAISLYEALGLGDEDGDGDADE